MTDITTVSSDTTKDRKRKRAAVVKFGLAGAALLGIAAAATSAAWSDQAWFSASAKAAEVSLTASVDSAPFVDADNEASGFDIAFGLLNQGESITKTLTIKNEGTVPLKITTQQLTLGTTGIFAGTPGGATADDPASVTVVGSESLVDTVLAANGGTADIQVLLTTPADWADTYQGATGIVTVQFDATSDLS